MLDVLLLAVVYLIPSVQYHDIISCQINLCEVTGHFFCLNVIMHLYKWLYNHGIIDHIKMNKSII